MDGWRSEEELILNPMELHGLLHVRTQSVAIRQYITLNNNLLFHSSIANKRIDRISNEEIKDLDMIHLIPNNGYFDEIANKQGSKKSLNFISLFNEFSIQSYFFSIYYKQRIINFFIVYIFFTIKESIYFNIFKTSIC